jgi:hypothetical protein
MPGDASTGGSSRATATAHRRLERQRIVATRGSTFRLPVANRGDA